MPSWPCGSSTPPSGSTRTTEKDGRNALPLPAFRRDQLAVILIIAVIIAVITLVRMIVRY